jgi:hypothetical protein
MEAVPELIRLVPVWCLSFAAGQRMAPGDPDLFLKFTQRGSLLSFSGIGKSGNKGHSI